MRQRIKLIIASGGISKVIHFDRETYNKRIEDVIGQIFNATREILESDYRPGRK